MLGITEGSKFSHGVAGTQGGLEWQHRWMARFARVVYLIQRSKKTVQARNAQQEQEKRRQLAQQPSLPPSGGHAGQQHPGQPQSAAPAMRARPPRPAAADLFEGLSSWRRTAGLAPAGVAAQRWLQQVPSRSTLDPLHVCCEWILCSVSS